MTQWQLPGFFIILVIAMTLISGCADEPAPVPVPTPVPTTTVAPTATAAPTPTLSAACQDLLAAADADIAFMNAMTDKKAYSRAWALSVNDCSLGPASAVNQVISEGPKPKTPSLVKARQFLMSSTTYCYETTAAMKTRTRDDLEKYFEKMTEYTDTVYSCPEQSDGTVIASLKKTLEPYGGTFLSGTDNQTHKVKVSGGGQRFFMMSYTGEGTFSVALEDKLKKSTLLHTSSNGAYSGTESKKFEAGDYFINVTARGPWTISVFNP
jgi:hypothetical protein